jgi:hypothetical protein
MRARGCTGRSSGFTCSCWPCVGSAWRRALSPPSWRLPALARAQQSPGAARSWPLWGYDWACSKTGSGACAARAG